MKDEWWQTIKIEDENGMKVGTIRVRMLDANPHVLRPVRVTLIKDKIIVTHPQKFTGYIDQLTIYNHAIKSIELKSMKGKKEKMVFT